MNKAEKGVIIFSKAILVMVVSFSIILWFRWKGENDIPPKTLEQIENDIEISTPDGTLLQNFYTSSNVVDPHWVAKLLMPEKQYVNFNTSLSQKTNLSASIENSLADSTSWWQPIHPVYRKKYLTDSNAFVSILCSRDDETNITVYIEYAL